MPGLSSRSLVNARRQFIASWTKARRQIKKIAKPRGRVVGGVDTESPPLSPASGTPGRFNRGRPGIQASAGQVFGRSDRDSNAASPSAPVAGQLLIDPRLVDAVGRYLRRLTALSNNSGDD